MTGTYNLIDEPWVPCRMPDGARTHFGLRELLCRAHAIAEVGCETPVVTASLIRLLVALAHRVHGGPTRIEDWVSLWRRGHFNPDKVDAYFHRWHQRFDLFDAKHPFLQVGDFHIVDQSGRPKPPTTTAGLLHESAAGNNPTLFDHAVDDAPVHLTPAHAARRLLAHQFFVLGGGKGATSDRFGEHPYLSAGPLVGGVLLIPTGGNLFETLTLNMVLPGFHKVSSKDDDAPAWEWDALPAPGKWQHQGYLSRLVYPSRYCRLVTSSPEADSHASPAVIGIHSAQALVLDDGSVSPWMASRQLKDGSVVPVPMRVDRLLWRDAHQFFATPRNTGGRLDGRPAVVRQLETLVTHVEELSHIAIDAFGLANDKAKLLAWRQETFRLPGTVLRDPELRAMLDESVARAEAIGSHVVSTVKPLAKLALFKDASYKPKGKEHDRLSAAIEPNPYWSLVDLPFRAFLGRLAVEPEASQAAFERQCCALARDSLNILVTRLGSPKAVFLKEMARAEASLEAWLRGTNCYQSYGGEDG